jgi:hypothetical protein
MTETITRLYDSYDQAAEAERALKQAGFTDADVSLIANKTAVHDTDVEGHTGSGAATGAGVGGVAGAAAGMLAGLGLLAIPGIGPVVAAGWLMSTLAVGAAGAVAGGATGGLLGALTESGVPADEAQVYSEGIRRGGAMISVRAPDSRAAEVRQLLSRFPSVDPVTRGDEYRRAGWSGFDESAGPYIPDSAAPRARPPL